MTRSADHPRSSLRLLFAVPAALAGYHVVLALSQIGVPSTGWREVFACLGAVSVGGTAWARLTDPRRARPFDRAEQSGAILSQFSTAAATTRR